MKRFNVDVFMNIGIQAAIAAMREVASYQLGIKEFSKAEVKESDQTLVTVADRDSQRAAFEVIRRLDPGAHIIGEEDKTADDGKDGWLIDPLDGTNGFSKGLITSTVVVAYRVQGIVVGCIIGEPISARIWVSGVGLMHFLTFADKGGHEVFGVCKTPVSEQSLVFLDVSHAFRGKNTDSQIARLFSSLSGEVKILMPGSNALMQALVAYGRDHMVGSITTAIGGPWDVCGVFLVRSAGGVAQAFKKTVQGDLADVNPLQVGDYDFLICANTQETLDFLTEKFVEAMS